MEDKKHDKRTVFVRGVSFDSTPADFEAFFSELGPVRTSFLVKDRGQTSHKGFGFVQFALPEDAQKAAAQLHNTEFQGRKLKVEAAVKRAPLEQRKKRKLGDVDAAAPSAQPQTEAPTAYVQPVLTKASPQTDKAAAPKPAKASARPLKKARKEKAVGGTVTNPKQQLVRTVALGNLHADTIARAIEFARSAGKVEAVIDPAPEAQVSQGRLKQDGCTGHVVFVVYESVKVALEAIAKLHGQKLAAAAEQPKKRHKGDKPDGTAHTLWARQVSGEGLHLKKWRLIIRNLAFKANPGELKAALEEGSGFVWDLMLPKKEDGTIKGFGFATFLTRGQAESAIRTTNGKAVGGRQVVVDWAVAKARFTDPSAQLTPGAEAQHGLEPAPISAAMTAAAAAADHEDMQVEDAQEGDSNLDSDHAADPADTAAEHKMMQGVLDSLLEDEADEGVKAGESGEPPKVAQQAAKQTGKSQLAGQADKAAAQKEGLRKEQSQDAAQQGRASNTGKTVFVRSLPPDVSKDQLYLAFKKFGGLRACRLVLDKASQQPKGTAFVEFYNASAASAAAAVCQQARDGKGGGVMVGGRTVEVDVALSQEDARSLASGKGPSPGGKDNRNLYLAKEGVIEEGSAAWEGMSVTDRGKRKRAAEEKNSKLRSPNFSVSRTRLSIRNIPFTMQEQQLKQLFIAAVKQHASKAQPRVKQAKILRDPEKGGGADGLARSRGLGFVEFLEHEHAICALRQLNNNPAPFGQDKRPIVEFALESAQAVRKMAAKQAWQKTQPKGGQAGQQKQEGADKPARPQAAAVAGKQARDKGQAKEALQRPAKQKVAGKKAAVSQAAQQQQPTKPAGSHAQAIHNKAGQAVVGKAAPQQKRKNAQAPVSQGTERKRKADASLDALAAQATHLNSGARQNKKPNKRDPRDKLDDMVASYKVKYFGQSAAASQSTGASKAGGISRWFE